MGSPRGRGGRLLYGRGRTALRLLLYGRGGAGTGSGRGRPGTGRPALCRLLLYGFGRICRRRGGRTALSPLATLPRGHGRGPATGLPPAVAAAIASIAGGGPPAGSSGPRPGPRGSTLTATALRGTCRAALRHPGAPQLVQGRPGPRAPPAPPRRPAPPAPGA
ncbi:hypothetical protein ACFW1M_14080, partial [Streptomyces inhibens]